MEKRPEVIVIGAGHNGLVAAAYLARAGHSVLVCERRERVGGAAVTEELALGFRASTASYALSLLRPDVYAELDLRRHGLEVVAKDPQMFVPLPDGRSFCVWRDAQRTAEEIGRVNARDAEGYARWCAFWDDVVPSLRALVDDPEARSPEEVLTGDVYRLVVAGSAAELVEAFFEAPEVQGAFASQGIIGTWRSVRDDGTAWVLAYHALGGELYGSSGTWGFARGGMGAVSEALHAAAREAGAEVRCGATVSQILVEGGRTVGVVLAEGTPIRAGAVVSGADPRTTFADLAGREDLVSEWRTPGCVLKVNLALSDAPAIEELRGTIEISPSLDYLDRAYKEAAANGFSSRPFMEVFCASAVDPSLVDGNGHVVSIFSQYVAPGSGATAEAVDAVLDTLASYAPNVRGAIVACEALGPLELEARFGLAGGNIFHGEITPDQSFGRRFDYRTPIDGLYLCGSGARPGGGVMGAAGRNAARVVLSDLGRE